MTYEEMIPVLRSNHFYPVKEITVGKKGDTVTGLRVECAPILLISKTERITEVLDGFKVRITPFANEGYLLIKKIK